MMIVSDTDTRDALRAFVRYKARKASTIFLRSFYHGESNRDHPDINRYLACPVAYITRLMTCATSTNYSNMARIALLLCWAL